MWQGLECTLQRDQPVAEAHGIDFRAPELADAIGKVGHLCSATLLDLSKGRARDERDAVAHDRCKQGVGSRSRRCLVREPDHVMIEAVFVYGNTPHLLLARQGFLAFARLQNGASAETSIRVPTPNASIGAPRAR